MIASGFQGRALGCVLLLAGLWGLATGCATVREEQRPLADTTLTVTRAGEDMTLGWTALPDVDYVIWYADRRDAQARWQVLPGAERITGRGRPVIWRDRVSAGQNRYYRLQAVPAAARAP